MELLCSGENCRNPPEIYCSCNPKLFYCSRHFNHHLRENISNVGSHIDTYISEANNASSIFIGEHILNLKEQVDRLIVSGAFFTRRLKNEIKERVNLLNQKIHELEKFKNHPIFSDNEISKIEDLGQFRINIKSEKEIEQFMEIFFSNDKSQKEESLSQKLESAESNCKQLMETLVEKEEEIQKLQESQKRSNEVLANIIAERVALESHLFTVLDDISKRDEEINQYKSIINSNNIKENDLPQVKNVNEIAEKEFIPPPFCEKVEDSKPFEVKLPPNYEQYANEEIKPVNQPVRNSDYYPQGLIHRNSESFNQNRPPPLRPSFSNTQNLSAKEKNHQIFNKLEENFPNSSNDFSKSLSQDNRPPPLNNRNFQFIPPDLNNFSTSPCVPNVQIIPKLPPNFTGFPCEVNKPPTILQQPIPILPPKLNQEIPMKNLPPPFRNTVHEKFNNFQGNPFSKND